LEGRDPFPEMTKKKQTETIAAIREVLQYLAEDVKATEAKDVAFYIGAALEAAEEFVAIEKSRRRRVGKSAAAK
jgi:hypothetical protein